MIEFFAMHANNYTESKGKHNIRKIHSYVSKFITSVVIFDGRAICHNDCIARSSSRICPVTLLK
jgi:hypothetical protein